jgi:DNA-directed RNA polymerase beta' subunit
MKDKNIPAGPVYYSKIYDLAFYVLNSKEIVTESYVAVKNKEIMRADVPVTNGLYDPRMGTTEFMWNCHTCGNKKLICSGHIGSIDLKYPVKSPMFRDEILKWLKITCYYCGEPVVELKKSHAPNKRLAKMCSVAKLVKECPYCKKPHMHVVKDKKQPFIFLRQTEDKKKIVEQKEFFNHDIKRVLDMIRPDTVIKLGKPLRSHPSNFILTTIEAPPNTMRPDIKKIGGTRSSNSDTTSLLKTIVEINENLPAIIPSNEHITPIYKDAYANLDLAYFSMIKGGGGGDIKMITNTNKPPVAISDRLTKKKGRFRENLMGKRVEYMIRSVITGDSRIKINQIGVPMMHARDLEVPETLTESNRARLTQYFINRTDKYPGCKHIIKASTGGTYRIDKIDKDYQLQVGDIIMRDMITGDYLCFNRQPSLLFSNIAGMYVVVMETGDTLRINPAICKYFNADFDGDQMNCIVPQNIQARNECMTTSKVARLFISPQTHAPDIGAFFDGLIGISEITRAGVKLNKWHAMQLFTDVFTEGINYDFPDKMVTNRNIVSRLLHKINISGKEPSMYKSQYANFIKYHPEDIKIVIERGELKSGVLDKAIMGQGVAGSIFQIIGNDYGNDVALETIYNLQQIVHKFFSYAGYTTGIADINISEETMAEIKRRLTTMILESRKITQRLNNGKLIAPIGTSLRQFYEIEQLGALATGDDFVYPIIADVDVESNGLIKLILSGSKGAFSNFTSINGAIGVQTVNGKRFLPQSGWGRTSPYFVRYDTDPKASGFISMSFREGITSDVYSFAAGEARQGAISNALSTSVTGYQNRISIKNLESIIIDNMRKAAKGANIIQPLYGELGLDPSKMEKVKFPSVMISDKEFTEQYKTNIDKLDKKFRNKAVEDLLAEEFKQLSTDRAEFRRIHTQLENHNPKEYVFTNQKHMPINVYRIIEDIIYNYRDVLDQVSKNDNIFDPIYCITSVKQLCEKLPYTFMNETQQRLKRRLPNYLVSATMMLQILIRSYLCTSYLLKKNINNSLIDIIIKKICITYKKALIDPGYPVGILAAQCISEPMTQYVLNSKHRVGGQGGTKTDAIVRVQEILGAKDTDTMKNPHMTIIVKPEYEHDKIKVQEIANHIEMMNFKRFVSNKRVFYESYGSPKHPDFLHEANEIRSFEKHNFGIKIPGDLAKWCIRYGLDREELILKGMKLETIILAIRRKYPEIFIMHTPENAKDVYIRCYIRNSMIKKYDDYLSDIVMHYMTEIGNVIVRGVKDILATSVIEVLKNSLKEDGSYELKKVYGIIATGTNITDILSNPYIDPYRTQSDSIEEIERVFGITAARSKIINEMMIALDGLNRIHCGIFADEMCFSGMVTNIQKTGLQKRENANITLRVSFQTALQVLQDAAIHGLVDRISGISGPLVVGTNPNIGTTYNSIVVNQQFLEENAKTLDSVIEDL